MQRSPASRLRMRTTAVRSCCASHVTARRRLTGSPMPQARRAERSTCLRRTRPRAGRCTGATSKIRTVTNGPRCGWTQALPRRALIQYVGEQSEALLPKDPQGRYRAIQWTYAALNSVEPGVQHRVLLDAFYGDQEWAKLRKPSADEFARLKLKRVSDWLGDNQWLEGDRFTIGDLIMITVLRFANKGGLLADTPNLAAYVERGEARPAFQRA